MKKESKWTLFWDMCSGGGLKEDPYDLIFIEAPKEKAKVVFYNRFGHNPERVTCTCCGPDYSIEESDNILQASAFHRGCAWGDKEKEYVERAASGFLSSGKYIPFEDFKKEKNVLIVEEKDIKPSEYEGTVPEQGYVWKD